MTTPSPNAPLPRLPRRHNTISVDSRSAALGIIFMITAAMLHSLGSVISKILLEVFSAPQLSLLRNIFTLISLLIIVIIYYRDKIKLTKKDIPSLIGYGIASTVVSPFMFLNAIDRVSVGVVLIVEYTAPILIIFWLRIFNGTRIRPGIIIGVSICMIGLMLVALPTGGVEVDGVGMAFAFGAAVSLAAGYLLAGKALEKRPAPIVSLFGFIIGTVAWIVVVPAWNFPADLLFNEIAIPQLEKLDSIPALWIILSIAIFCSVTPALMVLQGVKLIGPARASAISMSEPVFSTIIAWIILSEYLNSYQILGGIIAIMGLIYLEGPWRKPT